MASGEYQFVTWLRTGVGALLGGAARDVTLDLGPAGSVTAPVTPYGPSDVSALGPGAIVRMVPAPNVIDFEPNLFPSVELAHPALPWMLSPPPDANGHVTPWLVLVVVEDRPGVALERTGERTLLVIDTPADPAGELPDLGDAWAWAHAQAIAGASAPLDIADLSRSRGEGRARLVCPRRLVANARYIACVVPAFAPDGHTLAWTTPPSTSIRLPVFHAWHFGTGPGGDFASLAQRLVPQKLDASIGHRVVDASDPGWGMPQTSDLVVDVPGALVSPAWEPLPDAAAALGDAILAAIDAAADPAPSTSPAFPPPFYGGAATRTMRVADSPTWQDRLNRDIDQRIGAGLGASLVRANQDDFVDAVWRAAGEAERANRVIRHAELAIAVSQRLLARHVAPNDDAEVLGMARPLLARARMPAAPRTIARALAESAMPSAALSPSLRRLARPGAAIGRRTAVNAGRVLERADTGRLQPAPSPALPDGAAALDAVSRDEHVEARWQSASPAAIDAARTFWHAQVPHRRRPVTPPVSGRAIALRRRTDVPDVEVGELPPLVSVDADPVTIDEFANAARRHQMYLFSAIHPSGPARPLGRPGVRPLAELRATILATLDPQRALSAQLDARIPGTGGNPVVVRSVLERPLIAKLDPDDVLPSIDKIEQDRVAIALPAHAMVRAILVGANDELGRELLWRRFPGALGHTWLRTFWGRTRIEPDGARVAVPDIDPIESWPDAGPPLAAAQLVLVIRGELLRRYPNTLVYAVPARWTGPHRVVGTAPLQPVIAQTIAEDVALFGFDLDEDSARGGDVPSGPAGWYFVIEEHPSEPRFGLAVSSETLETWRELAWDDVVPGDLAGEHVRAGGPLVAVRPTTHGDLRWGGDAAQLAAITLRRPTRVAFHASVLLP